MRSDATPSMAMPRGDPAMVGLLKRAVPVLLALAGLGLLTGPSAACPFCTMQGKTLLQEMDDASMVLYGTLTSGNEKAETTDFAIDLVVKDDPKVGAAKKKTITLSRYIDPASPDGKPYKYLIFCDIFKGKIDAYRGMACKADSKLAAYLQGALNVKDKPIGDRLRYFFDYLDCPDVEASNDAYKEFGNADYKDYRDMAKTLPPERIVKWLRDPETPSFRFGLYASMLGHCGKKEHVKVLETLLHDPDKRVTTGIDGILAGYVMLDTEKGWKYVQGLLDNPKKEFMERYAALRAVRFLREYRTDIVKEKELLDGMCKLLSQDDISDLAVEDLRRWQAWDRADKVLAVVKESPYKQPIVRRSILRYCLQCKGVAAADAYVAEKRKADPEAVQEAEELLKLEADIPAPMKKDK